jgi:DNA repair protein RadD
MRVDYQIGFNEFKSEWVCPEHTGYARRKFEKWWKLRSNAPFPNSAQDAAAMANDGALATASKIIVKSVAGEKFDRIADYELGNIPEYTPEPGWNDVSEDDWQPPNYPDDDFDDDEIPF